MPRPFDHGHPDALMYKTGARRQAASVTLDELEWRRENERLAEEERDRAVTELIELVGAVDGILQMQAPADAEYFVRRAGRAFSPVEVTAIRDFVLRAYRSQYIVTGVREPRFVDLLSAPVTPAQMDRIGKALSPILV
jgi:hypothetical protein